MKSCMIYLLFIYFYMSVIIVIIVSKFRFHAQLKKNWYFKRIQEFCNRKFNNLQVFVLFSPQISFVDFDIIFLMLICLFHFNTCFTGVFNKRLLVEFDCLFTWINQRKLSKHERFFIQGDTLIINPCNIGTSRGNEDSRKKNYSS